MSTPFDENTSLLFVVMEDAPKNLQAHERLKWARTKAGYRSARAAALENGWAESTYGAHENAIRKFKLDEARKYGRRFRVNYLWLLSGEGEPGFKPGAVAVPPPPLEHAERLQTVLSILNVLIKIYDVPITEAGAKFLASYLTRGGSGEEIGEIQLEELGRVLKDI